MTVEAPGTTILVTTRPFETPKAESTASELSLRIGRTGLAMPLAGISLVSIVIGLSIYFVFPHLPWRNSGVLAKIPAIAWSAGGFTFCFLLAIIGINVARARPDEVLLLLKHSPDGVRCTHNSREVTLIDPTITVGPDHELWAAMQKQGVAVNPLHRDLVILSGAAARVAIYSAGTREVKHTVFDPIERWLRSRV